MTPASADGPARPRRILVVDDSTAMRKAVRRELGDAYLIQEARHGVEALELIKGGFAPDLITLDVAMPELDGFETCERLYSDEFAAYFPPDRQRRVPVVFLTSRDTPAERRRGYELGCIDFVSKRLEPGSLAGLVSQILNPDDRLRGVQVLVVDDSPTIRHIVSRALREVGVEAIEARDGLEAYTILCNRLSSIDLVITDIEMPVMSGTELCQRIRREIGLTDLPIVFFSGGDESARLKAFRAGATDCLVKPIIKEEMISRLTVHIEKATMNGRLRRALDELQVSLHRQRDMLATLSHDMRAPLGGIMGFADILAMGAQRTPPERENIDLIKQSGQMLLSLVEDVLSLSKQQSGQGDLVLEPLQLLPLVTRSVAMFRGLAGRKGQDIVFENGGREVTIAGHAEALTRVFNNLISNALKFTPTGGSVRVSVDSSTAGSVTIVVADTGVGIDPGKIDSIFDRYSKASRAGTAGEASTGLGMSIVREFVEAHSGKIVVTSELGRGTRFHLTFATIAAATAVEQGGAGRLDSESRHEQLVRLVKGMRVLVVDDNPVNLIVARTILTNAGCVVKTVDSGSGALDILNAGSAQWDVVFMDMQMPGMDGLETTRAIRHAGMDSIPVIGLTGNTGAEDRAQCLEAGMNDFLSKPFSPAALLELVLKHGKRVAEAIATG